jgi:hypothetical protein
MSAKPGFAFFSALNAEPGTLNVYFKEEDHGDKSIGTGVSQV